MKRIQTVKLAGILAAGGVAIGAIVASGLGSSMSVLAGTAASTGLTANIDAEALFRSECASCHGRDGQATTRAGRRANATDLTDAKNQAAFSDQRAFLNLKLGIERDGREVKKPFGKGFAEDEGLTDEQILALVEFTRTFGPGEWTEEKNKAAYEADKDKANLDKLLQEHGPDPWK